MPPLDAVTLPDDITARLLAIREQMIRDVAAAVANIEPLLQQSADAVQAEILAVVDLPARQRSAAVRRLLESYHVADAETLTRAIEGQLKDAAGYAARYADIVSMGGLAATASDIVTDSDTAFLLTRAEGSAQAALAIERRDLSTRGRPPKPITEGDKVAQKHLRRFPGTSNISRALHGKAVANSREASRLVLRGIREAENVSTAARNMQRLIRTQGSRVAANEQLPKLLQQLEEAGRRLAKTGSPEDLREWQKITRKLRDYQHTLRETGTVRKAYLKLLQTIESPDFRVSQLGKTIQRWTYYKQRYRSEVWIRQETATAYRNLQMEQDRDRDYIIGYIWRMHRQTHNRWIKGRKRGRRRVGKPGRRRIFGGRHCICEVMANRRLSKDIASEYPGMGHPNCNCTFEPIVSRKKLLE